MGSSKVSRPVSPKQPGARQLAIVAFAMSVAVGSIGKARSAEVGDVVFTGNGPGSTVTSVRPRGSAGVELVLRLLEPNAREACQRNGQFDQGTAAGETCVKEMLGDETPLRVLVNCRARKITTRDGTYKAAPDVTMPWINTANPNDIIKGADLYRIVCRPARQLPRRT